MFISECWLLFALLSPVCWSLVYVLDSYCVEELFERPWIGSVTSALMMLALLPILLGGLLVTGITPVTVTEVALCGLAGGLFMAGQAAYLRALSLSESGIVAAHFNLLPLLLLLAGHWFLGERLSLSNYTGSLLLVVASVIFGLVDANAASRWESFCLMFLATGTQVAYFLILDQLLAGSPTYQTFVLVSVAMIAFGFAPLINAKNRSLVRGNWPRIRKALALLAGIEAANLLALAANQQAIALGTASLVAAVEATAPVFVFALSSTLYALFQKYGEPGAARRFPCKVTLAGIMAVGVWMVA